MPDHVHMLLKVPPKYSFAMTMGYQGQERHPHPPGTASHQGDVVRACVLGARVLCEHGRAGRGTDPAVHPRAGELQHDLDQGELEFE